MDTCNKYVNKIIHLFSEITENRSNSPPNILGRALTR